MLSGTTMSFVMIPEARVWIRCQLEFEPSKPYGFFIEREIFRRLCEGLWQYNQESDQLTVDEGNVLRPQIATSKPSRGGNGYAPLALAKAAFTRSGVNGISRNLTPVASKIALPIAAAVGIEAVYLPPRRNPCRAGRSRFV